jgi:shikimate kinase
LTGSPSPDAVGGSPAEHSTPVRIALIGLRATGKSTIGARLAERLRLPFHDSDQLLAARGASPSRVLREEGLASFRARESAVVRELATQPRGVLALGGGAIESPEVRAALAPWARVLLDAPDEELLRRMASADAPERPPLTDLSPAEELGRLRAERASLYTSLATVMIRTEDCSVDAVVDRIIAGLDSGGGGAR